MSAFWTERGGGKGVKVNEEQGLSPLLAGSFGRHRSGVLEWAYVRSTRSGHVPVCSAAFRLDISAFWFCVFRSAFRQQLFLNSAADFCWTPVEVKPERSISDDRCARF